MDMRDTAGGSQTISFGMFFNRPLYLDASEFSDQQEITYLSFVRTQDVVWKTSWERWMRGTDRVIVREIRSVSMNWWWWWWWWWSLRDCSKIASLRAKPGIEKNVTGTDRLSNENRHCQQRIPNDNSLLQSSSDYHWNNQRNIWVK